ncbi:MAG: ankyrin repeat domain-containing protein [Candidatus Babeliales bacterium]|jgi:hypothetical protein
MNGFMRLVLCVAVFASGVVGSSKAGGGAVSALPENIFQAIHQQSISGVDYCLGQLRHDVNAIDYDWNTPLHIAAQMGNADIVSRLLSYGANPNVTNRAGFRPVDVAANDYVRQILMQTSGTSYMYPGY